ncbi:MAG TPA: hypothetical protein VE863_14970 [Pyrinomonadaceae bacterium]|nr:hypothetical protein [Pyrinomonadaceae bacterium]
MSGNLCREVRREIDELELSQPLSETSEAHVSVCAACATFRGERGRLRQLVGGLHPVTAPADFEMRLRARIARERDVPKQPFIFRFVMSTPAIAVAAVLVIAVGTTVFISQRTHTQAPALASGTGNEQLAPKPADKIIADGQTHESGLTSQGTSDSGRGKESTVAARQGPKTTVGLNAGPQVNDFGVRGAQTVSMLDRNGEVSLSAPQKPMVVTMYDEQGRARKIQLPAISFGSQRLTDNRTPVGMTNTKDW